MSGISDEKAPLDDCLDAHLCLKTLAKPKSAARRSSLFLEGGEAGEAGEGGGGGEGGGQ
jgi:hypothetical protein